MAHNPLLGSRISLISKKNIRYDGTLYSINEADATVALENVKSYGTEGRELLDTTGSSTFVPPQDVVHAYLLFRGQDIKDLHVHEKQAGGGDEEGQLKQQEEEGSNEQKQQGSKEGAVDKDKQKGKEEESGSVKEEDGGGNTNKDNKTQKPKSNNAAASNTTKQRKNMVGSGASLLHKNMRGGKGVGTDVPPKEFDFESNLDRFDKVDADANENEQDSNNNNTNNNNDSSNISGSNVYSKDDFFDSISCDALDKAQGIDNRLRGAAERSLNLDTFGAVSLGHNRRGGRGGRGGGRGRGRGRGYGRGGRGRGSYNNNDGGGNRDGDYSGSRRGGTVGSGPAPKQNNRWKSSN
ncbi:hypothetical protein ACHAWO_013945 [Cyclotella atomus]|uniref:TFG box profile domain-containing protein n=1 Tax=Cyclotella atomus TaxID=382360 RepID=A0ABD3PWM6_9STRA